MKAGKHRSWLMLVAVLVAALRATAAPPVHLDRKGEKWAASTLRQMTLEEKIGQMIMVWAHAEFLNVESPEYQKLREEMRTYHVGGFGVTLTYDAGIPFKSEPLETAFLTNGLQKDSKYPLIFAADFERGLSMRLTGGTEFPAAMVFGAAGDKAMVKEFGSISARESRAIGIHWNWFPIADVNSNPANPIINTRSFGEDPAEVGAMVQAYIEGAHSQGLLTSVKHFPGHGDTDTDSHLALSRVTASAERLNTVELVPFRSAIAAGVDTVMVGHLIVPAIEPDPNLPASISPHVIDGLLKQQLGFKGLAVTDALDMAGLMHVFHGTDAEISGAEAVAAVKAGEDMIIIPSDLGGAYNGLLNAVKRGEIPESRIDASVLKILRMKASVGLNHNRFVDVNEVDKLVGRPEDQAFAQKVADRAITLVADQGQLLPLPAAAKGAPAEDAAPLVTVIFTDSARGSEGSRTFVEELRKRAPHSRVFYVDGMNADLTAAEVLAAAQGAGRVIAVAESVPNPRRTTHGHANGSAGLDSGPAGLLHELVKADGAKTVVVAFGNPYTGASVPGIETYLCTFSDTPVSAISLARALFGEIPVHGRLPVTLAGLGARGAGLDRDAVTAPLGQ